MVVQVQRLTVADFEKYIALPENRERLFELIEGDIVEKMPTQEHGIIVALIVAALIAFTKPRNLGRVGVEVRHKLPDDLENSRLPDVSYYADTTVPVVTKGAVPQMPDLAIEVKSPDDTLKDLRDKADYYLDHGSKMVWLVLPELKLVEIYTPDKEEILNENQSINGGDVLPEFTLSVKEIFAY